MNSKPLGLLYILHILVYTQVFPNLMYILVYSKGLPYLLHILVYTEDSPYPIHVQGLYPKKT